MRRLQIGIQLLAVSVASVPHAGVLALLRTLLAQQSAAELSAVTLQDAVQCDHLSTATNSHILVYPIPNLEGEVAPGRRQMNFVWYRNVAAGADIDELLVDRQGRRRSVSLRPGAVQQCYKDEVQALAAKSMAPPIAEVVHRTAERFVQVILDIAFPAMAFDRVCLIGDAAFAVRPQAAAGSAKAARDAWALAEMLEAADGNVEVELRSWEPIQLEIGRQVMPRAADLRPRLFG